MNAPNASSVDRQKEARRVIELEVDGMKQLADNLPVDFEDVVDLILGCEGRLIVSGVGKSGHIGCKISATLASTGTPSQFVHSTEASHGDLGMITEKDVLLLISNSGSTSELRDLIAYAQRFSIPLIGLSSNMDSPLMRASNHRLLLPKAKEACAIGMAPTTSTTLTLALGDALAVTLMVCRGFQPEDFKNFHPGGKLGAQMSKVKDIMHGVDELPLVDFNTSMGDTILEMTSRGFGIAGVVQDGVLLGVVTDGDLRRNMSELMDKTAGEVASKTPLTVSPETLAPNALKVIQDNKIGALFVTNEQNHPVGVLNVHDLLRLGVV
ncbi:MAG: KpsF/GutQ family sugar-phosphate isomerase [Ponticaulis sp.]|nr:KpsF/GutQ family sugar-phosphate isomerase [Ponticaulis sp.]|tara:strand:- start:12022 stop:12993 length:972 start_codon:yes stop_codon:yes gene_type:complete